MRRLVGKAPGEAREPRALLLAGLRADRDEATRRELHGVSLPAWEAALELATRHGVLPLLAQALLPVARSLEMPEAIRIRLERGWRASGIRNALVLAHLGEVLARFDAIDVPVIVLKGADLLERVYEDVGLRPMADVDLLVRPDHVGRAVEALGALGYAPEDAGGPHPSRQAAQAHENLHVAPMIRPGGLRIEVHYALAAASEEGAIDHDGVWSRAEPARIGGARALVLSPEDLLLHLCIHLASHHGFAARLVQLSDIPAVVDRWPDRIDWSLLWSRARAWGVERSVYATLSLAGRLLRWVPPAGALEGHASPPLGSGIAEACEQLLFEESSLPTGSANFVRVMASGSAREKVGLALARAFLPPREMAFRYGVPPRSPALLVRYPLRAVELLGRYAGRAAQVLRKDSEAVRAMEMGQRRARLVTWLRGGKFEGGPPDNRPVPG